ncbi:MAG: DUF3857 domain-containing protein, partial [Bacteroidetes bacterium]|nr:DUF3857 domain-containing protein [Bacteroidota bacterium]
MNTKNFMSVLLLFITFYTFSQDNLYSSLTIAPELKENANATIRSHDVLIELHSSTNMTVKSKRIITVYNKNGLYHLDSYESYNSFVKVKSINARVYNDYGEEIRRFKKKDFKDYSNSGTSLVSDSRYLALDYTPTEYPFTFVFEVETDWTTTAFIPTWNPIEGYFVSTQHSSFKVNYNSSKEKIRIKEKNLLEFNVKNNSSLSQLSYEANNLPAIKPESLTPSINDITPQVLVALSKFKLVNVDGVANNWKEFGKWRYEEMVLGRDGLLQT